MQNTLKHFLINEWPGMVAVILYFILACGCAALIFDNRRIEKENVKRDERVLKEILINRAVREKVLESLDELLKK